MAGLVSYGQSGYCGSSMSQNAVWAYDNGEKPKSEWTKARIISAIKEAESERKEYYDITPQWNEEDLKPFIKQALFDKFLHRSSWHHTSKYANETDFYAIDDDVLDKSKEEVLVSLQEIQKELKQEQIKRKAQTHKLVRGKLKWEEWVGSRSYGKFETFERECILVEGTDWAYLADGGKKKITGNHILRVEEFNRAPKGTKATYDRIIKKYVPAKFKN